MILDNIKSALIIISIILAAILIVKLQNKTEYYKELAEKNCCIDRRTIDIGFQPLEGIELDTLQKYAQSSIQGFFRPQLSDIDTTSLYKTCITDLDIGHQVCTWSSDLITCIRKLQYLEDMPQVYQD